MKKFSLKKCLAVLPFALTFAFALTGCGESYNTKTFHHKITIKNNTDSEQKVLFVNDSYGWCPCGAGNSAYGVLAFSDEGETVAANSSAVHDLSFVPASESYYLTFGAYISGRNGSYEMAMIPVHYSETTADIYVYKCNLKSTYTKTEYNTFYSTLTDDEKSVFEDFYNIYNSSYYDENEACIFCSAYYSEDSEEDLTKAVNALNAIADAHSDMKSDTPFAFVLSVY